MYRYSCKQTKRNELNWIEFAGLGERVRLCWRALSQYHILCGVGLVSKMTDVMPGWMTKTEAGFQTSMHCSLRKVMVFCYDMPCREERKGRTWSSSFRGTENGVT